MTKLFPTLLFLACAFPVISRSEGVDWEASAGVLPQEANLGFRVKESPGSVLAMRDGVLAIETNDDASAWIELPVPLPEPGARFVVEVDADAASQPGAAAIQIASGEKGVFSWLFDKSHLRVSTDAKNNHEYTAMDVTVRHIYRYEIDGLDVVVSVDGNQVYSGRLDEPLIDPVLSIGDLSPGGGQMRVYRIKVDAGVGATSGAAGTTGGVRIVRWKGPLEPGGRWEQSWPEKADAIVMEAAYVAAAARQAQFFYSVKENSASGWSPPRAGWRALPRPMSARKNFSSKFPMPPAKYPWFGQPPIQPTRSQ